MAWLAVAACSAAPNPHPNTPTPLGVMSTLPLLWAEAADVSELLAADGAGGWVRAELEARHAIEPVDVLDEASLAKVDLLLLAQPRALSPEENVALDSWVRRGGRLLLFADPMLTHHSRYAIGDRRRPQDVVLLSPILRHWGLELRFDPQAAQGARSIDVRGISMPVELPGSFAAPARSPCTVAGEGLLAECRIGKGRVTAIADAAVLDAPDQADVSSRRRALRLAMAAAFD